VQSPPAAPASRAALRRLPLVLGWLSVAGGACDCDEQLATLVPDIAVSPAALDWGTVVVGVGAVEQLQLGNRGTGALTIASIAVEPDDAGFVVRNPPRRVQAQLAEVVEVELSAPFPGTYDAELVIRSDDPDSPEVRVPLSGEGGVGRLVVSPDPLDLGVVHEGPGASRALTLSNDGFDFLSVTDAAFVDDVGFAVDTTSLPASLGPGESTTLSVSLSPTETMVAGLDVPALVDTLRIEATTGPRDVTVSARVNLAPVARAVERDSRRTTVKVGAGTPVFIDGSETYDPEGDDFAFQWSVAARPPSSFTAVLGQGQPLVRVTPDVVGQYVVRLRATDEHGAWREADVTILPRDLAIVLSWEPSATAPCRAYSADACAAMSDEERARLCCGQSDLDLHFIGPGGVLGDYGTCGPSASAAASGGVCPDVALCAEESDEHVDTCRSDGLDCAFANRSPDWGGAGGARNGRADDPRLDIDDVRGEGPEVVSLNTPPDGTYRVVVHYCLDRIGEPTDATIQVFDQGIAIATTQPERLDEGEAWVAAVLVRNAGAWNIVTQPGIFENAVPAGLCSR
jgi:hypothetical protein